MSAVITVARDGRMGIRMETERFLVRTLTEADVNERWAGWLNDPVATMMLNARPRHFTLDELRRYVRGFDQIERLLVGVFDRASGRHIGLAIGEYLPGRRKLRPSLLIGEPEFRSVGVLHDLERVAMELQFDGLQLDAIVANVLAHNAVAIAFSESRGWKLTQRLVGAKRSTRTGEAIDILVYEYSREMWEQRRRQEEAAAGAAR